MPTKTRTMWVCEKWNDYEPGEVFAVAPDERTALNWLERTRDAEVRRINKNRRDWAEVGEPVERMSRAEAVITPNEDRWSFTIGSSTWVVSQYPLLRAATTRTTEPAHAR